MINLTLFCDNLNMLDLLSIHCVHQNPFYKTHGMDFVRDFNLTLATITAKISVQTLISQFTGFSYNRITS